MIQDKLICHASGDFSKPFILGFYLYHIVQDKENQRGKMKRFPLVTYINIYNSFLDHS